MIDLDFTESLLKHFTHVTKRHHDDCLTLDCGESEVNKLFLHLRDEKTFDLLVDLTAIDHGETAEFRFSVVSHLYSRIHRDYLRIHSICEDNESPKFRAFPVFFQQPTGMKEKLLICSGYIFLIIQTLKEF